MLTRFVAAATLLGALLGGLYGFLHPEDDEPRG